jgi:hypothetical protein
MRLGIGDHIGHELSSFSATSSSGASLAHLNPSPQHPGATYRLGPLMASQQASAIRVET